MGFGVCWPVHDARVGRTDGARPGESSLADDRERVLSAHHSVGQDPVAVARAGRTTPGSSATSGAGAGRGATNKACLGPTRTGLRTVSRQAAS